MIEGAFRIPVVEDEQRIRELLNNHSQSRGSQVSKAPADKAAPSQPGGSFRSDPFGFGAARILGWRALGSPRAENDVATLTGCKGVPVNEVLV